LTRNNPYAKKFKRSLATKVVKTGIVPQAKGQDSNAAQHDDLWEKWAGSLESDADNKNTGYGLQALAIKTIGEAGSVLIRRRRRRVSDNLSVPLQIQLLEPDFIDTLKDNIVTNNGGIIRQGIEFDKIGRRVAYWLFPEHPGEQTSFRGFTSRRVPASEIIHVFDVDRPGAENDVPWTVASMTELKDYGDYKDAQLLKQKSAACFVASIYDIEMPDGVDSEEAEIPEEIEPGRFELCPPGKRIEFNDPPKVDKYSDFDKSNLRAIASGMGFSYEALTGDYSEVNFSSGRLGQGDMIDNIDYWRWCVLIPQFCDRIWAWFSEAAYLAGLVQEQTGATWTAPPHRYIEPVKESNAIKTQVRSGTKSHFQIIREAGHNNPREFLQEYAEGLKVLDELGIILDSDPRNINNDGDIQDIAQPADADADAEERILSLTE
jgi:lambda family phage portal protein